MRRVTTGRQIALAVDLAAGVRRPAVEAVRSGRAEERSRPSRGPSSPHHHLLTAGRAVFRAAVDRDHGVGQLLADRDRIRQIHDLRHHQVDARSCRRSSSRTPCCWPGSARSAACRSRRRRPAPTAAVAVLTIGASRRRHTWLDRDRRRGADVQARRRRLEPDRLRRGRRDSAPVNVQSQPLVAVKFTNVTCSGSVSVSVSPRPPSRCRRSRSSRCRSAPGPR